MSNYQQDELARLFAQNMNIVQPNPSTPNQQFRFQQQQPAEQATTYSSMHYTPTAHLRPKAASEPSTSPVPFEHQQPNQPSQPDETYITDADLEATLIQNSINPSSLLASQIHLYRTADLTQRLRLLELWRIAPPEYGDAELADHANPHWPHTSMKLEEDMARLRYERRMQGREGQVQQPLASDAAMQDTNIDGAAAPEPPRILQSMQQHHLYHPPQHQMEAEPYMSTGYQQQASQHRLDPVYAAAAAPMAVGGWGGEPDPAVSSAQMRQDMENRYGAFEQARHFEHLQALNREVEESRAAELTGGAGARGEEMVM